MIIKKKKMTTITPPPASALFLSLSGGIANANAGWLAKSTSLTADGQQPSPTASPPPRAGGERSENTSRTRPRPTIAAAAKHPKAAIPTRTRVELRQSHLPHSCKPAAVTPKKDLHTSIKIRNFAT